jgi:hypothetical protein
MHDHRLRLKPPAEDGANAIRLLKRSFRTAMRWNPGVERLCRNDNTSSEPPACRRHGNGWQASRLRHLDLVERRRNPARGGDEIRAALEQLRRQAVGYRRREL